jgi:CHASE2 domain-containing sensor protein
MNKYVSRLIYVDKSHNEKVNPLAYPFLIATLLYGVGFFGLGFWQGVALSSLFQSLFDLNSILPQVWGILALTASFSAFVTIFTRKTKWWSGIASMTGVLVWLFAGIVYGMYGYWIVLITVAVPNLFFWVWYYFRVRSYERQKRAGLVDP